MLPEKTFDDMISYLAAVLTPLHGEREAAALARLVIRAVTGRSQAELLRDGGMPFPGELLPKVNNILRQLKERKPVQYILGETEFYGCRIRVTPSVLIPRPETEELVDHVVRELKGKKEKISILDIGTGSGCIAVALAKHLPQTEVYACDVSEEILQVAKKNAAANGVKVHFFREDILHPVTAPEMMFRYIVSNPPYIPEEERKEMQPEVVRYEPPGALFVPEEDPLLFYRAILKFAETHLEKAGLLMAEVHEKYAGEVAQLFRKACMSAVEVKKDINGKERFVVCTACGKRHPPSLHKSYSG